MQVFWNFVTHICILIFEADQVYFKVQVTNFNHKEVSANPKPKTFNSQKP